MSNNENYLNEDFCKIRSSLEHFEILKKWRKENKNKEKDNENIRKCAS